MERNSTKVRREETLANQNFCSNVTQHQRLRKESLSVHDPRSTIKQATTEHTSMLFISLQQRIASESLHLLTATSRLWRFRPARSFCSHPELKKIQTRRTLRTAKAKLYRPRPACLQCGGGVVVVVVVPQHGTTRSRPAGQSRRRWLASLRRRSAITFALVSDGARNYLAEIAPPSLFFHSPFSLSDAGSHTARDELRENARRQRHHEKKASSF